MPPGRPFQKGDPRINRSGRKPGPDFRAIRNILASKEKGEEIVRRYEALADGAEDEKVRLEANNMLAKYRDGEPEPPPQGESDDEGGELTPEQLAQALMPQTTETPQ